MSDDPQPLEIVHSRRRLLLLGVVSILLAVGAVAAVLDGDVAAGHGGGRWVGLGAGAAGSANSWRYLSTRAALGMSAVILGLVGIIVLGNANVLMALCVLLFGLGGPVMLWLAFDDTPAVRLDETGVTLRPRPWRDPSTLPWEAVEGFSLLFLASTHQVVVHGDGRSSPGPRPRGVAPDVLAAVMVSRPGGEVEEFVEAAEAYRRSGPAPRDLE